MIHIPALHKHMTIERHTNTHTPPEKHTAGQTRAQMFVGKKCPFTGNIDYKHCFQKKKLKSTKLTIGKPLQ